jgi:hypothetical protein
VNPTSDRYTDAHVRGDLKLHRIAESYVRHYVGDFYMIIECRDRLGRGDVLTVSQVRAVLNFMRSDPNVGDLPVPTSPRYGNTVTDDSRTYRDALRRRPSYIDLPTKIHYTHGISLHKRARTIHIVDHRGSFIRYFPHASHKKFSDKFDLRLRWMCPANVPRIEIPSVSGLSHGGTRLITQHEADVLIANDLRYMCPGCNRLR